MCLVDTCNVMSHTDESQLSLQVCICDSCNVMSHTDES